MKTTAAIAASEMPEDGQPSLYEKIARLKAEQKAALMVHQMACVSARRMVQVLAQVLA